jgi:hypothetical protein
MSIQRHFAPISGRFEPEQVAGLTGIYRHAANELRSQDPTAMKIAKTLIITILSRLS